MEKILSNLDKEGKELILLSDTNCDFGNKENLTDSNAKHLSNIYNIYSLKQLIADPTRTTYSSSAIIGHIATSCVRNSVESGVYEVCMSDHYMVCCICKFNGAIGRDHKIVQTREIKSSAPKFWFCQSFQGSSIDLFMTNCINILIQITYLLMNNLVFIYCTLP